MLTAVIASRPNLIYVHIHDSDFPIFLRKLGSFVCVYMCARLCVYVHVSVCVCVYVCVRMRIDKENDKETLHACDDVFIRGM